MRAVDVPRYRPIVSAELSADGRWAAAVTPVYDARTDTRPLQLDLLELGSSSSWRRVGRDSGALTHFGPAFCPVSRRLAAFRGGPAGVELAVYTLARPDAPARVLPGLPARAGTLAWRSPDNRPVCLGDDADGWRRVHAWSSGRRRPTALTPAGQHVGDYDFRPDGSALAWVSVPHADAPESERLPIHFADGDGQHPRALRVPGRPVGHLAWSPDGRWLAYLARRAGHLLSGASLHIVDPERWPEHPDAARCLTRELDASITGFDWAPGSDGLTLAVVEGTYGRLYTVGLDGKRQALGPRRTYLSGPHHARTSDRLLHLQQDVGTPQRLCLREPAPASPRANRILTRFNRRLTKGSHLPGQTVRWTATDGLQLDGLLIAHDGPRPPPLLVWLHGGPAESITHTFSPYFQVLARAGFAVFAPNYRGSSGRGDLFLRASTGDLGGADVDDVLAGIDRVVQMGAADPDRTALVGWSYGGTLALHTARRSSIASAVCVGAPVVDWVAFFGAARMPRVYGEYFPRPLWVDRSPFDAASPITHIADLDTPTLVLHGGADGVVPVSQSRLLYRALKARGVDTDLMVYPGEPHVLTRPGAVTDMLHRVLSWCGTRLAL